MGKQIKVQLLTDDFGQTGILPIHGNKDAACFDLAMPYDSTIYAGTMMVIPLLVAFELPEWHYLRLYGRSSTFSRYGIIVPTSIVDYDYRKGVHALFYNALSTNVVLEKGQRVVQAELCEMEHYFLTVVDKIQETPRGGLGSTGK